MPGPVLDYEPRKEFDTGLFIARYFRVIASITLVLMILWPIVFGGFHFDITFLLLFVTANALEKHDNSFRVLALLGCGWKMIFTLVEIAALFFIGVRGTQITMAGYRVYHTEIIYVLIVGVVAFVVAAIPFFILMSPLARKQFAERTTGTSKSHAESK
jgi:hypothetical protein